MTTAHISILGPRHGLGQPDQPVFENPVVLFPPSPTVRWVHHPLTGWLLAGPSLPPSGGVVATWGCTASRPPGAGVYLAAKPRLPCTGAEAHRGVAQLVEQGAHNPHGAGSSPAPAMHRSLWSAPGERAAVGGASRSSRTDVPGTFLPRLGLRPPTFHSRRRPWPKHQ